MPKTIDKVKFLPEPKEHIRRWTCLKCGWMYISKTKAQYKKWCLNCNSSYCSSPDR